MSATVAAAGDLALALDYLAERVGVEDPSQLEALARALLAARWEFPPPERVTTHAATYGYRKCVATHGISSAEVSQCRRLSWARSLLQPIPEKPVVRKLCFLHQAAKLSPGFRLVATRSDSGAAAYIKNDVLNEDSACRLLKAGWSCLFVRKRNGRAGP